MSIVVRLTAEQIDGTLMNLQSGLELAFSRAKAWSKYLKDVMSYIERRAQLGKLKLKLTIVSIQITDL